MHEWPTAAGEGVTTGTVLLTLGRLPIALDLARSFSAAGWRVVVAEPFGMHLARMSKAVDCCHRVPAPAADPAGYLDAVRAVAERERVSCIVPISEETMHVAALRAVPPAGARIFCPPQSAALELQDKYAFNSRARELGLRVPASALPGTAAAARIAADGDAVIKPRRASSGRGVVFVPRGQPVPAVPDTLVQQRLAGPEVSSFTVAQSGRVLATVVYRGVVMSGSVAVCFERLLASGPVEDWARRLVEATGHTGFLGLDFILGADGQPAAIECNPRATSGIHFLETAGLCRAIVDGGELAAGSRRLLTESYSCFTAALGSLFDPAARRHNFGALRRADDVSWSRRDPWPFLLMMINTWPLIGRAIRRRQTFADVATRDLEWRAG
jgi:hypothetical protein